MCSKTTLGVHAMVAVFAVWLLTETSGSAQQPAGAPRIQGDVDCAVTSPNGIAAGEKNETGSYGNAQVSVGPFGLWPNGTVIFKPGGAGFVETDGALGMKFGWRRGVPGKLTIDGHRVDATAPPLRAEVPDGYGDRGFQATYVIFPTPGCWEVTGRVGDAKVTFITRVIKVGDGPPWRRTR
jgi:hypothetical protein